MKTILYLIGGLILIAVLGSAIDVGDRSECPNGYSVVVNGGRWACLNLAYIISTIQNNLSIQAGNITYNTNITINSGGNLSLNQTTYNFTSMDTSLKIWAKDHQYFGNQNGESIELHGTNPDSKAYIGWYSYDNWTQSNRPVGWIGCHYNGTAGVHQHCSWETLDNSSGVMTINTHFEISYGSNQSVATIKFPGSDVTFLNGQELYFGSQKNSSIWYNVPDLNIDAGNNNLDITADKITYGVITMNEGGTIRSTGSVMELNSSSSGAIRVNRYGAENTSQFAMSTLGVDKWAFQMRNDNVQDLYFRDQTNFKTVFQLRASSTSPQIIINNNTLLVITPNSTSMICNKANEGAIYYNNISKQHLGCNSTNWTAFASTSSSSSGGGTVTSITTGNGLSGGVITDSGIIALASNITDTLTEMQENTTRLNNTVITNTTALSVLAQTCHAELDSTNTSINQNIADLRTANTTNFNAHSTFIINNTPISPTNVNTTNIGLTGNITFLNADLCINGQGGRICFNGTNVIMQQSS